MFRSQLGVTWCLRCAAWTRTTGALLSAWKLAHDCGKGAS